MDDAATSSTSHKAGLLHSFEKPQARRHHSRSSTFPISLSLGFLRKKDRSRTPKAPVSVSGAAVETRIEPAEEPWEVAPGIWSNEATAKVFGYLDVPENNRRKGKQRGSRSTGPSDRWRKESSLSPGREEVQRDQASKAANINKDLGHSAQEGFAAEGVPRMHERKYERVNVSEETEVETDRGRVKFKRAQRKIRTVSKDDTFVARGANPRTGVVSPYATSESARSESMTRSRRDESAGWREKRTGRGMERTASGRWMQDSHGWSLVESPTPSPIPQPGTAPMGQRRSSVPVKELQDKFVVNMPSAKEPSPLQMSKEQIKEYQRSVERAYRDRIERYG